MPCYTPLAAYRGPGGRIVFSSKEGFSDRPLTLACGQCRGCRLERSRQWALRCMHEAQMHVLEDDGLCRCRERTCRGESAFLTLTYDQVNVPEDGGLVVRDWQLFAKRARKRIGKFRFFMCGEYGEENLRPHFHACLFGQGFTQDRVLFKRTKHGELFRSETLEQLWPHGFATLGHLTFKSAAYVARYVMKKRGADSARYERIDQVTGESYQVRPEFVTMSRRPGLGQGWYEKYKGDVFPDDFAVHDGRKLRVPRYYDGLLEREDPELLASLKAKRLKAAGKYSADQTPERLRVREQVNEARLSALRRSL